MEERIELALHRLAQIKDEYVIEGAFGEYFRKAADFCVRAYKGLYEEFGALDLEGKRALSHELHREFFSQGYEESFLNPVYAERELGEYGRMLSFLYYQLYGLIPILSEYRVYPHRGEDVAMLLEVLLQTYSAFESAKEVAGASGDKESEETAGALPTAEEIRDILYWFVSDYADVTIPYRIRELVDPDLSFARDIVMKSDLDNVEYLYEYGECVTEFEEKTAGYLATLSQERIKSLAYVFVDGYRRGFEKTGKDIRKKKTVGIYYSLGFERVVREAISLFEEMGLESVLFRHAVHLINGKSDTGYFSGERLRQSAYDHREDLALFLDKALNMRRLELLEEAYEEQKDKALSYGGPAVLECFGEKPFLPETNEARCTFSEAQQKLVTAYSAQASIITNRYIPETERSYTVMALPDARFGEKFGEIFDRTAKLNSLDFREYEKMQQCLVDILDKGEYAKVTGRDGNETDITVALHQLSDPEKQTVFENCTADVNIPVGEVFTSPVLEGTKGVLHVKQVYMEGLEYRDLKLVFKDGYVEDYSCKNFEDPKACKKYILENVLFQHKTLPLGEFAIGTNTEAYAMAKQFGVFDRLPILIAEKTGPHFAVGDTCYSRAEDIAVFNPDGKEIVARDNSCSAKRDTEPDKAYFNCHTDITIPYDELDCVTVVYPDGSSRDLIRGGRFVAPGTEKLNEPLEG